MIGTDIIEIERIREALKNDSFFSGAFSESEREYCKKKANINESLAGIFSAKEAVLKAMGKGITPNRLREITVLHEDSGKPVITLSGKLKEEFGSRRIEISISHCRLYATATALILE